MGTKCLEEEEKADLLRVAQGICCVVFEMRGELELVLFVCLFV